MSEETKTSEVKASRRSGSLFGPIILIAIGVFFLMDNLNLLPDLHWSVVLRLWPLLLIALGVNLIVRQAPPPVGTLLSGLVAVATVAFFGWLLVAGDALGLAGAATGRDVSREEVSFPAEDLESALVEINFSEFSSEVNALSDSPNLIEGTILHRGQVVFDTERSGDDATVRLSTERAGEDPFFWMNPANWFGMDTEGRWEIGLNPQVPLVLQLEMSSGSAEVDLSALSLSAFRVDGSSGSVDLQLPDGDYRGTYDVSSGSAEIWLPEDGQQRIQVDGGSGSLTFYLPEETEARVVVASSGSGSISPGDRLTQVEAFDDDEGAWETSGYDEDGPGVTFILDIGSGSVSIRQP